MLPGSKVVRVTPWSVNNPIWKGAPTQKGEIYKIREVYFEQAPIKGLMCIYLEGIHNPKIPFGVNMGREFGYDPTDFKEIDPLYNLFPDEKLANPEEHLILQPELT